jgi:hypothetical protein
VARVDVEVELVAGQAALEDLEVARAILAGGGDQA